MNTNLLNIVKQIITDYGEAVLADPQRLKAFFGDLAKDEPKPLRVAFGRCIEAGAYSALKTASDQSERAELKAAIAQRVRDEHGLDMALCGEALDILEATLPEEKTGSVDIAEAQPEEIDDLQKKLTQKNEDLIRCIQTIEILTSEKQQKEAALNKTKTGLKCAIVLGVLAAAISIGVGISQYNSAMTDYNNKYHEYNELEQRYSSLQSEMNKLSADYKTLSADYERSKTMWAIHVTSIRVGNWGDGEWLTRPGGGSLLARNIRYLKPVITYNSLISREVTFYVKIISPGGSIDRNNSTSPTGYTYSHTGQVSRGNYQSFDLTGWGNKDRSTYSAGEWTIEVWYEGVCLRSEKVRLY